MDTFCLEGEEMCEKAKYKFVCGTLGDLLQM